MPTQPPTYKKTVLRENEYSRMEKLIKEANEYASLFILRSHTEDPGSKSEISARMESIRIKNRIVQDALSRQPIDDALVSLAGRHCRNRDSDLVHNPGVQSGGEYWNNRLRGAIGRGLTYVRDTLPELWEEVQGHESHDREVACVPA
jgi:hypothetical protein